MGWFEREAVVRIWFGEGSEGKRENGEDGEDMGVDHLCLSERSVKGVWCVCVCVNKTNVIWTCELLYW